MTLITFDENKYLTAIHQSSDEVILEGGIEIDDLPFDELNDVHFNLDTYQYIDGKLVRDEKKYAALQEKRLKEKLAAQNKPTVEEMFNALLGVTE